MSGGKGGSQTTKVEIPEWMDKAAQRNVARAEDISQIGYTPYYGADVAAINPMQTAAMQNTSDWAKQFGMQSAGNPTTMMPQAQNFNGVQAYSSAPMFEQALADFTAKQPAQAKAIDDMFLGPTNSAASGGKGGGQVATPSPAPKPAPKPKPAASSGASWYTKEYDDFINNRGL